MVPVTLQENGFEIRPFVGSALAELFRVPSA